MWELSFLPFPGLFVPWEATLVGSGIIIRDPPAGLGAVLMLWARCPGGHEHLWKALEWLLILLTQHRFVGKPRILSSLLLPQPASLLALKAEEHRAWTKGSQWAVHRSLIPQDLGRLLRCWMLGLLPALQATSPDKCCPQKACPLLLCRFLPTGWEESSQKPDLREHALSLGPPNSRAPSASSEEAEGESWRMDLTYRTSQLTLAHFYWMRTAFASS